MSVQQIVHLNAEPEYASRVAELVRNALEPIRAEEGVVSYEFFTVTDDPTHMVFVEHYRDESGLEAHVQMPHLRQLVAALEPLMSRPFDVYRISPSG